MRTYLQVPFAEKEAAKSLGARFDMSRKQWYCPDGIDLMTFKRWLPRELQRWAKTPRGADCVKK